MPVCCWDKERRYAHGDRGADDEDEGEHKTEVEEGLKQQARGLPGLLHACLVWIWFGAVCAAALLRVVVSHQWESVMSYAHKPRARARTHAPV